MGAPSLPGLPPLVERFPKWSRTTAVLTITTPAYEDDTRSAIHVKKSHSGDLMASSLLISAQDYSFRVAHLEQSIKFLQEQHQQMLSGLHKEIESLRERNRDLQFQLIFNKESSSSKPSQTPNEESTENTTKEATRLNREAAAARGEARAAEARALQLQQLLDAQTERIRALELREREGCASCGAGGEGGGANEESPAELRARLADAERLVRRLRTDADRQRREVLAGGVTNLLFDDAAAHAAHLQCMKNSLTASLRVTGVDLGFSNHGYRPHNYHFPPLHQPDFWPEPREEFNHHMVAGRGRGRRPVTLPELQTNGHHIHQSTVYANHHTRQRANGYEHQYKNERKRGTIQHVMNDTVKPKSIDGQIESPVPQQSEFAVAVANANNPNAPRSRGKRSHHRKAASTDHT